MDLLTGDVELTEFEAIDVESIKGVGQGANGFPILMMKGLALAKGARDCPKCEKTYDADHQGATCEGCGADLPDAPASKAADDDADGPESDREAALALVKAIVGKKVDETPDIAGGTAVIAQIADLIIAEAQELKAGNTGEISDIQQLACAAEMIWCWRTGEEAVASGSVMPATGLMQSAQKGVDWTDEQWAAWVAELQKAIPSARLLPPGLAKGRDYSAAERKEMAGDGRALPDGSYPIADEHDLNSAAILARSGHGDVTAATKHIGKRAKELGVPNPLDNGTDTTKSAIAQEGADVDTVTQETGGLAKAVEEAVTKAIGPLQERLKSLDAELAKVKATPVPGGPVLSHNVQVKQPGSVVREDYAAKAAKYRDMAEQVNDRVTADGYRLLAREADAKAVTPAS
jgi:hypothetical protein